MQILGLRSYSDLQRSDFVEPVPVDCDVAPCELALDILDEEAEVRKKLSKKRSSKRANRGRSNLLGSDHKQATIGDSLTAAKWILYIILWQEEHPGCTLSGDVVTCFLGWII